MDIAAILSHGWPGASWSLVGNDYAGLVWHDTDIAKPTLAEIEAHAATMPATPVPVSVTARQGRLQLLADGLLSTVEGLMASADTDAALKIEWEYATTWERYSPWIGQLATALSLTDTDLDRMFTEGAAR